MFYLSIHQYFIPMDVTLVTAKKQNSLQGDVFSYVLQAHRQREVFFNYFLPGHYFELFFGLCNLSFFSLSYFPAYSQCVCSNAIIIALLEIIIFVYCWGSVSYFVSILFFCNRLIFRCITLFLCLIFFLFVRFFLFSLFTKYKDK